MSVVTTDESCFDAASAHSTNSIAAALFGFSCSLRCAAKLMTRPKSVAQLS
jgi:hypothetical protein